MNQFEVLLGHGLDVRIMIELSFKNHEAILNQLNNGVPLIQALCKNQKSSYFQNILYLSNFLSIQDAIQCARDIKTNSLGLVEEFIKRSAYSIFIILFSYIMILFFSKSIVPTMSTYADGDSTILILNFMKIIYTVLFIIVFLILILLLVMYLNKTIYIQFVKKCPYPILKVLFSIQFSAIFNTLLKKGLSTMECIKTISQMDSSFEAKTVSEDILMHLSKGQSIEESIASSSFTDSCLLQFFKLGQQSSNICHMLSLYQKNRELYLLNVIKKWTNGIQLFSYISVGFLVILVYQIMLYPLNMLNTF